MVESRFISKADLFYGSGDSTITSRGAFRKSESNNIYYTGEVNVSWKDLYDWDKERTYIPDRGYVYDREFDFLHDNGVASNFELNSDWKYEFSGSYNPFTESWEYKKWQRVD